MKEVLPVDEVFENHKLRRKIERRRRNLRIFALVVSVLIFAVAGWLYTLAPLSKIKAYTLSGNNVLSDESIAEKMDAVLDTWNALNDGPAIASVIKEEGIVKELSLSYPKVNELLIEIEEYKVLAYLLDSGQFLLENETLYTPSGTNVSSWGYLMVNGYTSEVHATRLAKELKALDFDLSGIVSEFIQEAKSYDESYAHLVMYDGIHVYTSLSSLEVLRHYKDIRTVLNPEHNCISIDEMSSVPYSFVCYP